MTHSDPNLFENLVCPLPLAHSDQIVISHGSGGKMTHDLVRDLFMPLLNNRFLQEANDFARVSLPPEAALKGRLAMSTDSHIVKPLFFPGGDIGRLAICGTVNDISMSGGTPLYLSAGFILEEGFSTGVLRQIITSMKEAAEEAQVFFVAGDTKVVEKGMADGLFITSTGIGYITEGREIGGEKARPGDAVIISGTLGDHAIAVLNARGELGFEANVTSDVAPLNHMIDDLIVAAPHTHVLRDPTRGGLATTLNEIAKQSQVSILIDEQSIPVHEPVKAACEMLGFDPLYLANEGKVVIFVPEDESDAALQSLRNNVYGKDAQKIGKVTGAPGAIVLLKTVIGASRVLDMLAGEILPRIC